MISIVFKILLSYNVFVSPSRFVVAGSLFLSFLLELIWIAIISKPSHKKHSVFGLEFSPSAFFIDFVIIFWLLVYGIYTSNSRLINEPKVIVSFFIFYVIWFIVGIFTNHFESTKKKSKYWAFVWVHIKAYIIFLALISFVIFLVPISQVINDQILRILTIYPFWSLVVFSFLFLSQKPDLTDDVKTKMFRISELKNFTYSPIVSKLNGKEIHSFSNNINYGTSLIEKLQGTYLRNDKDIFKFIESSINLSSFDPLQSMVIKSADIFNIEVVPDENLELYFNLHEINDVRRINNYFIEINHRLKNGGVFIGCVEPIKLRYKRFIKKYPFYLANFFYLIDFCLNRILPKLPFIKKIYFSVSKGKNRAISLAETLGRIYYCGFEVIGVKERGDFCYFIAKKIKVPSSDENPSYSPIFKMKRIGKNGKFIFVYKFRTMYPYSEYLQDFILKNFGYADNGKPANDFRLTTWGKFFRKYWLDELPQLINVVKGEMKLFGIRPLSERFLKEYPSEFLELRKKQKPGCVPPYVALLKQDVQEYINSEMIYLKDKEKHPYTTDIKYFSKAVYNILTNKIRSA
ncbi:MAG: sugar transferase [Ignavibacteria bacterium]|nr:sugar transferase [Ignavibacteria bacterium]